MKIPLFLALAVGLLVAVDRCEGDVTAKGPKTLEGTWLAAEAARDGVALPEEEAKNTTVELRNKRYTIRVGGTITEKGSFTVNTAVKPATMDVNPDKKLAYLGIYEVKDDTLTMCFAAPGKARPTVLRTAKGSGHSLYFLRRARP